MMEKITFIEGASPRLSNKKGIVACDLDIPDDLFGKELYLECVNDGLDIAYSKDFFTIIVTMQISNSYIV